ncbi:helix-turn-helix domain-containing protein [Owenweeksia hongkongensis]|uniref:AlbA family DNA-binding domain-containing protein n=1 Tax=Owenweeksia hongkongensis TaxID=253245 RepID=UPI003A946CDF
MNSKGAPSNHPRQLDQIQGTEFDLNRMIKEGEHQKQDFKFRIDSSQKIAKTLCAFANTDGGKLLIGVKDNGRLAGIDPEEEFYMIDGAANIYCKPAIEFYSTVYSAEDKLILEIDVPPSIDRPHFAKSEDQKWIAYVRQNDENFMANRVLLSYLRDKTPKSERKNLIAYGDHERMLFDYLSENEEISLSKFSKVAKIPIRKAEKTLALFIKWEIISWKATEAGIRFSLVG